MVYEQNKKRTTLYESSQMGVTGLEPQNVKNDAQSTYAKDENQTVQDTVQISDILQKWDTLPDEIKQVIIGLLK
jgi:hypothetical protein